jgi:hypothetical protein
MIVLDTSVLSKKYFNRNLLRRGHFRGALVKLIRNVDCQIHLRPSMMDRSFCGLISEFQTARRR